VARLLTSDCFVHGLVRTPYIPIKREVGLPVFYKDGKAGFLNIICPATLLRHVSKFSLYLSKDSFLDLHRIIMLKHYPVSAGNLCHTLMI